MFHPSNAGLDSRHNLTLKIAWFAKRVSKWDQNFYDSLDHWAPSAEARFFCRFNGAMSNNAPRATRATVLPSLPELQKKPVNPQTDAGTFPELSDFSTNTGMIGLSLRSNCILWDNLEIINDVYQFRRSVITMTIYDMLSFERWVAPGWLRTGQTSGCLAGRWGALRRFTVFPHSFDLYYSHTQDRDKKII